MGKKKKANKVKRAEQAAEEEFYHLVEKITLAGFNTSAPALSKRKKKKKKKKKKK